MAQAAEHVPFDQLDESKVRHKEEKERLESIHSKQMQQAYLRSRFANAWNWVDAYFREEYGVDSETYHLLRTALVSRRLLLLLDGLDEGGAARDEIERHIVEVLAPQGHQILITSRLNLKVELFTRHLSTWSYCHRTSGRRSSSSGGSPRSEGRMSCSITSASMSLWTRRPARG